MSRSEIEKFFSDEDDVLSDRNTHLVASDDWSDDDFMEGQLSLDMYQTDNEVVIKAPIAGVRKDDIEVVVTDDAVSIKGKREREVEERKDNFFLHECYWGSFSRSQALPAQVVSEKAEATLKDGVLTIRVPKSHKGKSRALKIKTE